MKFVAAYLLACLGAAEGAEGAEAPAPSKEDVRRILASVGAEVEEEDRLDLLFAQLEGKDLSELIAAGREQLAYAPSGAVAVAVGALAAGAAAEAKEEEAKEDEEEEEDENMFSLFDD